MKNNIIKVYFILLIILTSGTVYFSLLHGKVFVTLLFLSSLALIFKKRRINQYNINILSIYLGFLFINLVFNFFNSVSYSTISGLIIKVMCITIVLSELDIKDFKKYYIDIIAVLSVVSLINFSLYALFPKIKFPLMFHEIIAGNWFTYAPYHTWGWETTFNRNAGMFWEPGAFQAFICLAILMLIDDKLNNLETIKNKILLLILFFITILSTKSTTGYIILIIIFVYSIIDNLALLKKNIVYFISDMNRKKIIVASIIFIFVISSLVIMLNNGVITKKLTNKNPSYSIRSDDFNNSLKIISRRPLMGYGFMSKATIKEEEKYNIKDNSNGLLYFTYMFGIPIAVILMVLYYNGLKRLLPNIKPYYSFIILIIIFMSEYLLLMPLFLAITFSLSESKMKYIELNDLKSLSIIKILFHKQ